MRNLEEKIAHSIKKKNPFVLFKKPNATTGKAYFQKNNTTYFTDDFSENGFVFAAFDSTEKILSIPFSFADEFSFEVNVNPTSFTSEIKNNTSKKEKQQHIKLVQNGIDFINNSKIDKVVLSRKESVALKDFNVFQAYRKLLENYPNAFVYLWFHPVSGFWMGATPEVLLSVKNQEFTVMALASTQEYKGSLEVVWNEKEKQEHQFVIDYIVSQLKNYPLKISKTETVKAGNLVHLRAIISGEIKGDDFQLSELIKMLHPTPAICGLPKKEAKEFILKNENYKREYYTGFLGEINNSTTDLYVNLRCMKVDFENKNVSLYIGGGITKDSNPQCEWEETVSKAMVMKKVL